MTPQPTFTLQDIGCFVDGHHGIYQGEQIQELALAYGWPGPAVSVDATDSYHEVTDEAVDYLNTLCADEVIFTYGEDGLCFVLVPVAELEEAA